MRRFRNAYFFEAVVWRQFGEPKTTPAPPIRSISCNPLLQRPSTTIDQPNDKRTTGNLALPQRALTPKLSNDANQANTKRCGCESNDFVRARVRIKQCDACKTRQSETLPQLRGDSAGAGMTAPPASATHADLRVSGRLLVFNFNLGGGSGEENTWALLLYVI
jgi:hypothetical protein